MHQDFFTLDYYLFFKIMLTVKYSVVFDLQMFSFNNYVS